MAPKEDMTHHRRPADQARFILSDATVIADLIDPAWHTMEDTIGGYPTSTPGASPSDSGPPAECGHPECSNDRPCPNHGGGLPVDTVRRDREKATKLLNRVEGDMADIARIMVRYGLGGIDKSTVKARLVAIDAEIWCSNCGRHGFKNPRLEGRTECDLCAGFRRDTDYPCPKDILDIAASGRRVSVNDIKRIMDRQHPGWDRKGKKRGQAA